MLHTSAKELISASDEFQPTLMRIAPLIMSLVNPIADNTWLELTLPEEQVKFAGTAEGFLSDGSETIHLHVIKFDNQVVGFFKIDFCTLCE